MKRQKLYWVLQFSGWFAWTLNEALLYTMQYGWRWAWLYAFVGNISLAILLTHQYKRITQKFQWQNYPLFKLLRINLQALLAMSTILLAFNLPLDFALLQENYEVKLNTFIILQYLFNFMKPLAIWQLIYFFFQYSQRKLEIERQNDQLERTIQETEGKVLRAQMNPHFVFNALNSIRALITEDPNKAKKGINQLSKLLRSSLLTERKKTIPLSEEIETIVDYLSLEKIRYEDRLFWEVQIPKEHVKAEVPPMILQTLVENAIKHGISHSVKGGTIIIQAHKIGNLLHAYVINPGTIKTKESETGVGIKNSISRLKILFGETAQLRLKPFDKNQVIAELIIPYLVP